MNATLDPRQLFTDRHATYVRFIRAMRYPQGLRAFFESSSLLRPGMRILDAGCGTGVVTLAFREAMARRGLSTSAQHAFDLTPAMLERFQESLHKRGVTDVALAEANVLDLTALPAAWTNYDVILSASMLEYVPRDRFIDAIRGLRTRLNEHGAFVLFITRRNPLTRVLIGRWWESNLYATRELHGAFQRAGFSNVSFRSFPLAGRHLSVWGHIVEGKR